MNDNYDSTRVLPIEEAARELVNSIATMVHSVIFAKTNGPTPAPSEPAPAPEATEEVRSLEYRPEDRAADEARALVEAQEAAAQAARDIFERRATPGESIRLAGFGRGKTYGERALPQSQFQVRGARYTFPDSLRTALATILREEPAVDELYDITVGDIEDVKYRVVRNREPDGRSLTLTCNKFEGQIAFTVDDLAEVEVAM